MSSEPSWSADIILSRIPRKISRAGTFQNSVQLQLVDGDIGQLETARRITGMALDRFESIDALVNVAGIMIAKAFMITPRRISGVSFQPTSEGSIHLTQLSVLQMLKQKSGGTIVTITASLADHPMAGHGHRIGRHDHERWAQCGNKVVGHGIRQAGDSSERSRTGNRAH